MIQLIKQHKISFFVILCLTIVLTSLQMLSAFRGLSHAEAMDQAQIARNIAVGRGNVTGVLRPIEVNNMAALSGIYLNKEAKDLEEEISIRDKKTQQLIEEGKPVASSKLTLPYLTNTQYAPLYTWLEAGVFKSLSFIGVDLWGPMGKESNIYLADRVLAGISGIFYIIAVILSFTLVLRLFDLTIAVFSSIFILISNIYLGYALSGLPIMMMMCLFLGACHFLTQALDRDNDKKNAWLSITLSSVCMVLICMCGWLGLWPLLGFILFIILHFKDKHVYAIPAILALICCCVPIFYLTYQATGSVGGSAFYSIYTSFIGNDSEIYRDMTTGSYSSDAAGILSTFTTQIIARIESLYQQFGSILIAPIFFLALFHTFKNKLTQDMKWALFCMWLFSFIGVSLFCPIEELSSSQIQIFFGTLFASYGLAFILVMIARLPVKKQKMCRFAVFTLLIIITVLPFSLSLPDNVRLGMRFIESGRPNWPPYYAPGLNKSLQENTKQDEIIMSDQPWAVAWYADRPSLWMPKKVAQFEQINHVVRLKNHRIAGLLVSPISLMDNSIPTIIKNYDEFAPFVMEGTIVNMTGPEKPVYIADVAPSTQEYLKYLSKLDSRLQIINNQLIFYRHAEH